MKRYRSYFALVTVACRCSADGGEEIFGPSAILAQWRKKKTVASAANGPTAWKIPA